MSGRDAIRMSAREAERFLEEERTVVCATLGRDGWPHLTALWYVRRGDELWAWTYAKSQKARNLERDPRATLQVEAGESYAELRGVTLETTAAIHRDVALVGEIGEALRRRYGASGSGASVADQARKRVALQFVERRRVTWDHRKLVAGGAGS